MKSIRESIIGRKGNTVSVIPPPLMNHDIVVMQVDINQHGMSPLMGSLLGHQVYERFVVIMNDYELDQVEEIKYINNTKLFAKNFSQHSSNGILFYTTARSNRPNKHYNICYLDEFDKYLKLDRKINPGCIVEIYRCPGFSNEIVQNVWKTFTWDNIGNKLLKNYKLIWRHPEIEDIPELLP